MVVIALTIVGSVLALYAIVYAIQGAMIFPRHAAGPALSEPPAGVEAVWINTDTDDRVEAWFMAGRGRSAGAPGPAVMFFHGNAELIDFNSARMRPYVDAGVSVLLVEYRGYGRSTGTPTQRGIVADSERFRAWLDARPEVDTARVTYHGRSLGGGVAVQLAARWAPEALVLESTFTSVPDVAGVPLAGLIVRHPFRSSEVISDLTCPILFLHGADDRLIPHEHSERLAQRAQNGRVVLLPGGHNDFPQDEEPFWTAVIGFVTEGVAE